MQLTRVIQSAGLVFTVVSSSLSTNAFAQTTPTTPNIRTDIQPFATLVIGPAPLERRNWNHGGGHPAFDISAGARKRVRGLFGVVASANYGKMLDVGLGFGEDAICMVRVPGPPGCIPLQPVLAWFGATAGAEAYLGKAILGLQFGPTAVSAPKIERDGVPGSPAHEWGLRTQFDATFPLYQRLGINLAATDRYVPHIVNDRWHIRSISVGFTLREFHK